MGSSKDKQSKSDNQLLAGTQKHFSATATLQFGGGSHAVADVTGALQRRIAAAEARVAAATAFHAAVQAENAVVEQTGALVGDYETFVRATFGSDIGALGDFGLAPHKKRVVKPKVKAQAVARAVETRKLRGTMGKQQRKQAPKAAGAPANAAPAAPAEPQTSTPAQAPAETPPAKKA